MGVDEPPRAPRAQHGRSIALLGTSTARPSPSAASSVASFGTLGLATHRGLATLGQMLAGRRLHPADDPDHCPR
jgi:hypothetical protein